jgi:hypothetical protein
MLTTIDHEAASILNERLDLQHQKWQRHRRAPAQQGNVPTSMQRRTPLAPDPSQIYGASNKSTLPFMKMSQCNQSKNANPSNESTTIKSNNPSVYHYRNFCDSGLEMHRVSIN